MTDEAYIRLIGGTTELSALKDGGDDAVATFYRSLIPRLTGDVTHIEPVSRLVGFRAEADTGKEYRFLGVETYVVQEIPGGMIGFAVSESSIHVTGPDSSEVSHPIRWAWRKTTPLGVIGEFYAPIPLDCAHPHGGRVRLFSLTAHSPVDVKHPIPEEDAVALSDPDPSWSGEFTRMAERLRAEFPEAVGRIEHYGSTAVPGIPAKPVIDILVETPSFDTARRALIPGLSGPEWEYWEYTDHMIFIKRREFRGPRTHHVHIAPAGHRLWEGVIFRDYIAAHPDTAREYAALKRELSILYRTDREAYTKAKTEFIEAVLEQAKSGTGE